MINQNSKTQIQNRINAATGATTLNDLLLLRKAAEGLCCDETNLDTLIAAALNAQNGATPINQVFAGKVAAGLRGRVAYQTPIAVKAGDELFIDALGKVKTEQYPMRGAVALTGVPTDPSLLGTFTAAAKGYVCTGRVQAASSGAFGAVLALSDGNLLYLFAGRGNTLDQLLHAAVIGPDEITVLSTHQLTPLVNGSYYSNQQSVVGVFEVSANVFRVYYTTGDSDSTSAKVIRYVTLTYNTGTKGLSSAAGADVVTGSVNTDYSSSGAAIKQGDRYVLVGVNSSGTQFCLDMLTSTVVTYTGVSTMTNMTEFDMSTPGDEYAYALNSSVPYLMKAGADARLAVPANLTTDGCFGLTWSVSLIGPRSFLAVKANNPVKLVKFSTDWASCTIYTVAGATPASVASQPSSRPLVLKGDNNRYFVKTSSIEPMFSFVWDGASSPTAVDLTTGWLATVPVASFFAKKFPVLTSADRVTYAAASGQTIPDASSTYSALMYSYFTFDAAEMTGYTPGRLGIVINDATANSLTEFEPDDGTKVSSATLLRAETVGKNGLRRTLKRDRLAIVTTSVKLGTAGLTETFFENTAADYLTQNGAKGLSMRTVAPGAALISNPKVTLSGSAFGAASQTSACNVSLLTVEGSVDHSNNVTGTTNGTAEASVCVTTDKPVLMAFGGRSARINWEREL
ncbi:MAG TPA: hypothetical protein DF774_02175 [Rheinheimera sp.]|uniref:hypothetical protein n=1 Tax=Rheinheimera sp. TaxID=1869214 RepID=UPI000EBB2C99|nr:hypothetical protein [Rheinheimera sp.]HCU64547.1 hypothetical protein [Rheinheimera sp.]